MLPGNKQSKILVATYNKVIFHSDSLYITGQRRQMVGRYCSPNLFTPGSKMTEQPPIPVLSSTNDRGKRTSGKVPHLQLNAVFIQKRHLSLLISGQWSEISHMTSTTTQNQETQFLKMDSRTKQWTQGT